MKFWILVIFLSSSIQLFAQLKDADIEEKDGHITVTMTLTSMGCPVGPSLMRSVQTEMERYLGAEEVTVKLVWEPVWNRQMINPDVYAMLFD